MTAILAAIKRLTRIAFYRFGVHTAEHVIRVLLISGVVITSLVYPALAIQIYSQPLSQVSTRILDALFVANTKNAIYSPPVREIWQGHDALRVRKDASAIGRCGVERTIAIERLLVPGAVHDEKGGERGPLDPSILSAAYGVHQDVLAGLEDLWTSSSGSGVGVACVRDEKGGCLNLNPFLAIRSKGGVGYEDYGETLQALNTPVYVSDIPVHVDSVLAGHTPGEHFVNDPVYLAFTYFLEDDCQGNARHNAWMHVLKDTIGTHAKVDASRSVGHIVTLEYADAPSNGFTAVSALLYFTYLVIFVYFSGSLRRMETVHSRYGLAFTGIVECIASTMCSLSVCAILGFQVNMVPKSMLPLIIVFVGAENMFSLVEAVTSTDIRNPVKQRIAAGLSQAGTSTSLKVVTYNAILGAIAFFAAGAVRQFCVFAIVVLVAHWFLIHTMFVAVLAIDLHRLELNDLLRQGMTLKPTAPSPAKGTHKQKAAPTAPWSGRLRGILTRRAAKNGSLLLMLAIMCALYYTTYSFPEAVESRQPRMRNETSGTMMPQSDDSSARLWRLLNPDNHPLLHVRIEAPAFLSFTPTQSDLDSRHSKWRLPLRALGPILHLTKIILIPIFITNALLYVLLRYLLKDADVLETQRDRDNVILPTPTLPAPEEVVLTTLDRACAHEIKLIASSDDASVIASASTGDELVVWLDREGRYMEINCATLKGKAISNNISISAIAVDRSGHYCAVGTAHGSVAVWSLTGDEPVLQARAHDVSASAVRLLSLVPQRGSPKSGPSSGRTPNQNTTPVVIVVGSNGEVFEWSFLSSSTPSSLPASDSNTSLAPVIISSPSLPFPRIVVPTTHQSVDVLDFSDGAWRTALSIGLGDEDDPIVRIHAQNLSIASQTVPYLVAVTESNRVILINAETGDVAGCIDDILGSVSRVRLTSVGAVSCPTCAELRSPSITIAVSSHNIVYVYSIALSAASERCLCPRVDVAVGSRLLVSDGLRSRRSSTTTSSRSASPARNRSSRLHSSPSISSLRQYPMYGHGVHSRRDKSRQMSEASDNPSMIAEQSVPQMFSVPPPLASSISPGGHLAPHETSMRRPVRIAVVRCERGSWDLSGEQVIGIRRRSRIEQDLRRGDQGGSDSLMTSAGARLTTTNGNGGDRASNQSLSSSVLDRWELWTVDAMGVLRASSLSELGHSLPLALSARHGGTGGISNLFFHRESLATGPPAPTPSNHSHPHRYPRLPFTNVPVFTATASSTHCVVGFGNTVGVIRLPGTWTRTMTTTTITSLSTTSSTPTPPLKKRIVANLSPPKPAHSLAHGSARLRP